MGRQIHSKSHVRSHERRFSIFIHHINLRFLLHQNFINYNHVNIFQNLSTKIYTYIIYFVIYKLCGLHVIFLRKRDSRHIDFLKIIKLKNMQKVINRVFSKKMRIVLMLSSRGRSVSYQFFFQDMTKRSMVQCYNKIKY